LTVPQPIPAGPAAIAITYTGVLNDKLRGFYISNANNRSYAVTFPAGQEPPVNGFWSLTLYNAQHLFNPNNLDRFSLGTKSKSMVRNADGSLTIYAGMKPPGPEGLPNWLPAPDGPFSLYIRAYWGKEPILDGSWQPPKILAAN